MRPNAHLNAGFERNLSREPEAPAPNANRLRYIDPNADPNAEINAHLQNAAPNADSNADSDAAPNAQANANIAEPTRACGKDVGARVPMTPCMGA